MTSAERQLVHAAPGPAQGFVSELAIVDGLRLHIRKRPGAGVPWVLLHGLAVSHRYLMPTAAALPGPVYVPDLPGFGLSADPGRVLTVEEHAAVIAAWIDAAGLGGVQVIANSYGCQVAVELAVRRPELVRSLVLVGPTPDPTARTARAQVARWVLDLVREDPRQLPMIAADVRDAGLRRVLGTLRDCVRHRIDDRLPLVTAPTLVLRGEHDTIVPAGWAAEAARLIPHGAFGDVPGAAHNAVTTAGPEVAARAELARSGDGRPWY